MVEQSFRTERDSMGEVKVPKGPYCGAQTQRAVVSRPKGSREIHPNDHVNMCQSSNDVIPKALHCGARIGVERELRKISSYLPKTN